MAGNSMDGSCTVKGKSTQVSDELTYSAESVKRLLGRLDVLRSRLAGVLLVSPPSPCTPGTSAPQEGLVPLADEIRSRRRMVDQAIEQVDEMINGLQL